MNSQKNQPQLEIKLLHAHDDAQMFSPAYQSVLREFSTSTKPDIHRAFTMDSVDGGGGALGEYLFKYSNIILPVISTAICAYLTGRSGRRVKIKFGDIEVEAANTEEIENALKLVEEYKARLASPTPPSTP